jgi:hypothetical protein
VEEYARGIKESKVRHPSPNPNRRFHRKER